MTREEAYIGGQKLQTYIYKTDPTIHPFPTSAKNFFVGNHRLSGHPTPITNVSYTIKKAQHKQWRAKATKKTMYTEVDPSITHEANKTTLSTNTCIKIQSLALAGRHQGCINLQSPLCDPRILKSKAHKYKSPECKFCHFIPLRILFTSLGSACHGTTSVLLETTNSRTWHTSKVSIYPRTCS